MSLLLAIDVGNSGVHCGLYEGPECRRVWRCGPQDPGLGLARNEAVTVEAAIACSVAPSALEQARAALGAELSARLRVLRDPTQVGIRTAYHRPEMVGMDRLVACRAALALYPPHCLVIDLGTAITFDVVDRERGHLGGAIGPGVALSAWALPERAELLPALELAALPAPDELIARSTTGGLSSGLIHGFASMVDGMIRRIRRQVGAPLTVVATGGDAELIVPHCEEPIETHECLVLEGLRLIAGAGG